MNVSRFRDVGRFTYSLSVDTEFWSGEVEFTGLTKEELNGDLFVESSKQYITIEGWRADNDSIQVAFALDTNAPKKGQINILESKNGDEITHSVIPRPEAIKLGLQFLDGENALHKLDEIYDASYPSIVGKFTSEVRYIFDFESHTAIMNEICRYDNGTMSYQIKETAVQYFKNMMVGRNKFMITSRDELENKIDLYNSFEHLPDLQFNDIREEYLDWWNPEDSETVPKDFGFKIPA